jgi:3-hydroxyacyl-CoA dehydrogenase
MRRKIRQVAVIGAGVMGGGITALLASAGIKTLLIDIVPSDLKDDERNDKDAKNRIVKNGFDAMLLARPALLMQPSDANLVSLGNLEDDFAKLANCDLIIEVVVENLGVKRQLFERIETIRKPGTIVSSNTSGIPLKSISEGRSQAFKQYFLGTHFFNPVRYMKLLEIIPGEDTLPEVIEFMSNFGERHLGKGIVTAKDTPNFIANRIGTQGIVKTMQLMAEDGLTIPQVDALFGSAMGRPKTAIFKTSDLVGIDILSHVAHNTHELVVDDEDRASFVLPAFVEKMVENNLLGKKTNSGFYRTESTADRKRIRKVINPDTLEYQSYEAVDFPCLLEAKNKKTLPERLRAIVYGNDKGAVFAWKAIASNLIYAANRIPEISDTIVEIDNAMKWGYNMELGPFETWDAIGLKASTEKMAQEGMPIPQKINQMIAVGHDAFYKSDDGEKTFYDFATETYQPLPLDLGSNLRLTFVRKL